MVDGQTVAIGLALLGWSAALVGVVYKAVIRRIDCLEAKIAKYRDTFVTREQCETLHKHIEELLQLTIRPVADQIERLTERLENGTLGEYHRQITELRERVVALEERIKGAPRRAKGAR